jgi:hypothetical protein
MRIKSLTFPTYLEDIMDIENDNIDVFVEGEDGYTYVVTVGTPKNLDYLMDTEKMNYFDGHPFIIVKKLTQEIILHAYAEKDDGYWIKLYYFAGYMNMTVFNQLQAEQILDELDNS